MSLRLNNGTTPDCLEVKTHPSSIESDVRIGEYYLSIEDFCAVVKYVLTNTDLASPEDPRVALVEQIKKLEPQPAEMSCCRRYVFLE